MQLLVRAYPIQEGQEDALRQFTEQVREKWSETSRFYQKYGVSRESWFLQMIGEKLHLISVTQINDLQPALDAYGASQDDYDRWFKDQIFQLTGLNLDEVPAGPPSQMVYDWQNS